MQTILNRQPWASCQFDQLTLDQLSDKQLLVKQTKNRQMGGVVLTLIVLMLAMTFILENYLVAVTTWAMIPAVDEYVKKRKAINKQLQKRNLV
jgi:hypothetical protein